MNILVAATMALVVVATSYVAYLGIYAWLRPSGSPTANEPTEPTVSVVLPTYNESPIVKGKLEEFCDWDYPVEKIEVSVVDMSDGETPSLNLVGGEGSAKWEVDAEFREVSE